MLQADDAMIVKPDLYILNKRCLMEHSRLLFVKERIFCAFVPKPYIPLPR